MKTPTGGEVVLFESDAMETDLSPRPGIDAIPLNPIRVETALSRYPVHRLSRKGSIRIEVREGSVREEPAVNWKVSHNSEYGQPGPLAYKLDTLIINRRIEEARRPIPRILKLGSLSDLCRELNLSDSGKNRADLKRSLFQNAFAGITAKTTYRMADGTERTLEAAFTRYSVILTGEKLPDGTKADGVYIVLNDVFIKVINGAMTRPLDYDYLKSLPPAPQRFYELLSYQMYAALKHDRPRAKLNYSDLCSHAPQTRHFDWNNVRSQMSKIHRLHKASGYIAKVDFQGTTDSDGKPDWIMLYMPGPKARAEFKAFTKRGGPNVVEIEQDPMPLIVDSEQTELESDLIGRGVTPAIARDLVRGYAEEKIREQIEILDWLAKKKPEKIDEPAGWLVSAIRNGHATPKGFVSTAERLRRQEAKKAKEQQELEQSRRRQKQIAEEQAEKEAIAAYRQSLTPQALAQLEADAVALAHEETRRSLDDPSVAMFRNTLVHRVTDDHIRNILCNRPNGQPPSPAP
jgi:DNA-binding TFAR19-related protein (PDSD5 family)